MISRNEYGSFLAAGGAFCYSIFYLCILMAEEKQANNPLHGKTLEFILKQLVWHYDWPELGKLINIACFNKDPSLKSSLTFLRKTEWARKKVEKLYLNTFH